MKRVGIIGGMGSMASADLYMKIVKLTPAKCDQDHILLTIDNNAKIPDRTNYIYGDGKDPFPYLLDSVKRLENSGCDAFCMACNTAHYFAPRLIAETKMKFLDMPKITVENISTNYKNAKKVAVVGTITTRKSKIYDKNLEKYGFESVEFSKEIENDIMKCIYEGVKAGKIAEKKDFFIETMSKIDADIFIAACTEIPLFLPFVPNEFKFVDATEELAKEIIKFANS